MVLAVLSSVQESCPSIELFFHPFKTDETVFVQCLLLAPFAPMRP